MDESIIIRSKWIHVDKSLGSHLTFKYTNATLDSFNENLFLRTSENHT